MGYEFYDPDNHDFLAFCQVCSAQSNQSAYVRFKCGTTLSSMAASGDHLDIEEGSPQRMRDVIDSRIRPELNGPHLWGRLELMSRGSSPRPIGPPFTMRLRNDEYGDDDSGKEPPKNERQAHGIAVVGVTRFLVDRGRIDTGIIMRLMEHNAALRDENADMRMQIAVMTVEQRLGTDAQKMATMRDIAMKFGDQLPKGMELVEKWLLVEAIKASGKVPPKPPTTPDIDAEIHEMEAKAAWLAENQPEVFMALAERLMPLYAIAQAKAAENKQKAAAQAQADAAAKGA